MLALLFIACGLAGVYAQTVTNTVCDCNTSPGLIRGLTVCGTDGKTYDNFCALVNAQKTTTGGGLGMKCLGKCPCPEIVGIRDKCSRYWAATPGLVPTPAPTRPPTTTVPPTTPTTVPDFVRPRPGRQAGYDDRHFSGYGGNNYYDPYYGYNSYNNYYPPPPPYNNYNPGYNYPSYNYNGRSCYSMDFQLPRGPICLTNGTTYNERDHRAAICAMMNPNRQDIGLRCLGDCNRCGAYPLCPGITTIPVPTPTPGPSPSPPGPGPTPPGPGPTPGPSPSPGPPPDDVTDFIPNLHRIMLTPFSDPNK